jgi:hypothetical protein
VNISQISARRIAKSHAAQNHWIAERLFDRSGIPVTHLRPTFFAEWLMYFWESIREKNMFPLPFGHARCAPIAAKDQGRVIAAILNNSAEHAGSLYGPQELTQYEVADILTQVFGRKITYAARGEYPNNNHWNLYRAHARGPSPAILIRLSGHSRSQETKWSSVFHLLMSHPASLRIVVAVMIARACAPPGRRSRSRHCYEIKWITPEPSTARVTTLPAHG